MDNYRLSDLVKIAKGTDRTLKEYEKASGVDAAIISKIISGKYTPKRTKILKALTSESAAPRGGVTFEQLLQAADLSKSLEDGLMDGVTATHAVLKAIGEMPVYSLPSYSKTNPYATPIAQLTVMAAKLISSRLENKNSVEQETKVEQTIDEIHRFVAIANGILYGAMGQKGIVFMPGTQDDGAFNQESLSTCLMIQNNKIEEYLFKYIYLNDIDKQEPFIVENTAKRIIEQLLFLEPKQSRKISIVVNSKESFEYLSRLKEKISFKGNLTVLWISDKKVCVKAEEYIAYYGEENKLLSILD